MVRLLLAVVGASLLPIASAGRSAAWAGAESSEAFVRDLQSAVGRQDRKAIAAMTEYPLTVLLRSMRIPIPDAAALIKHYDTIFTPDLRAEIRDAGPDRIKMSGGTLTLAGRITARRVGDTWKITGITVPTRPHTGSVATDARRAAARRLVIGTRPAQLSGTLLPRGTDSYIVWLEHGRLLDVRIVGVPGRTIVAHVLHARPNTPVDARARDGARVWTGRVPESGDYLIEFVRTEHGDGSALPYAATVTVR